ALSLCAIHLKADQSAFVLILYVDDFGPRGGLELGADFVEVGGRILAILVKREVLHIDTLEPLHEALELRFALLVPEKFRSHREDRPFEVDIDFVGGPGGELFPVEPNAASRLGLRGGLGYQDDKANEFTHGWSSGSNRKFSFGRHSACCW